MRRSKYFAVIAIVIVLIGTELILDRLIGFPDIGRVTDVMNGESLEKIGSRFVKLQMRIVRINQMLNETGIKIEQTRRLNACWVDLDRSWSAFRRKPGGLKARMRFARSFAGIQKVLGEFRPSVAARIDRTDETTGQILLFHIDSFSDAIIDLDRYTQNESQAEVWIGGRLMGIVILVILALALFIIQHRMHSRKKRDQKT